MPAASFVRGHCDALHRRSHSRRVRLRRRRAADVRRLARVSGNDGLCGSRHVGPRGHGSRQSAAGSHDAACHGRSPCGRFRLRCVARARPARGSIAARVGRRGHRNPRRRGRPAGCSRRKARASRSLSSASARPAPSSRRVCRWPGLRRCGPPSRTRTFRSFMPASAGF